MKTEFDSKADMWTHINELEVELNKIIHKKGRHSKEYICLLEDLK